MPTWHKAYPAEVITPPKRNSRNAGTQVCRRWLTGIRQVVEAVKGSLQQGFRLDRKRPHVIWRQALRCVPQAMPLTPLRFSPTPD
jgi:hypothetical protein